MKNFIPEQNVTSVAGRRNTYPIFAASDVPMRMNFITPLMLLGCFCCSPLLPVIPETLRLISSPIGIIGVLVAVMSAASRFAAKRVVPEPVDRLTQLV